MSKGKFEKLINKLTTVIEDETLYFRLVGKENCIKVIRLFVHLWFWLLGVSVMIFGLLTGFKKMKSLFFGDDW